MLKEKIIVVTGAAGKLGQSFVNAIANNGAVAVAADIDFRAAERIAASAENGSTGCIVAAHLDITNIKSIQELIENLLHEYGRIDAVVNNAYPRGKNYGNKLENVTYEDFCENVDMHLGGYFLVAQQFCLAFRDQGQGNVVNMSSIYGAINPRFEVYADTDMTTPVEYAAIKSAIVQLTKYFAKYFKGDGIRVNSLSPGGIFDDQPVSFLDAYNKHCGKKGMLDPKDLIGALIFLLSNNSHYMTGQNLIIDDGFSL